MDTENLRKEFTARAALLREAFAETTPSKVNLDSFVEGAARELEAKQIKLDEMFKLFDEQGIGMIYKNSLNQFGFALADASEEGAFRYQLFDAKGFFAHSTFTTAEEAILELCDNGYHELVAADTLDKFSATREWKFSTEALALRTGVQTGRYTHQEALRKYADLEMKYDPDLWVA
ncbi:hypothetical protein F2S72_09585 [Pseudomonas syringae pv. actinidiae]|nr:hypothetical protein [Pseudomonas syringae pv. actinidiae]